MSRDKQKATSINRGVCMFCGGTLWRCDEDGDVYYPTDDWVTCDDSDCQRGAIRADKYDSPYQCDSPSECPHFESWHDSECDDCDRQDCNDCDKQDCEYCDRIDDYELDEKYENIANDLMEAIKSFREEDGRFVENTLEDIRKNVEKIAQEVKDGDY